ncbi:Plant PDR ABC transporter associated [Musa troglodytarum]|uniref:Plant PDR ABC transporter associated n=1 Tax=Musa troglodytarum TaxID=320322 RepID=A0A9E7GNS5_9LILI|nr:Plant PDR ABC transporter associated [Musa troglodytarum]
MWNATEAVFSRSSSFRECSEDDEEEALRWAALERLPTYSRVRRGILRGAAGDCSEVDVARLSSGDRTALIDRLLVDSGDAEHFFRRIRQRFDAVNLEFPKIEVRFQELKVDAYVHVGSRALPTIPNFIFNMTEAFMRYLRIFRGRQRKLTILDSIGGIIRPSRMTLLLGPPSSGKTTLLLALAGRLGNNLQSAGIKPDEDLDLFMKALALEGKQTNLVVEYILKLLLVALITMTVFFRTTMHHNSVDDGLVYVGALYFALIMILFNGFTEVSLLITKLPVIYKHRDLNFYPAWTYTIPSWILSIPTSLMETGMWVAVTYYVVGYDPQITRFLSQFLLLFFLHQMALALFRVMASLGRNMIVANTFGSFAMLKVAKYNITLGEAALKEYGMFTESYWFWIGICALFGYTILFNILFTLFLTYLNPLGKQQAVVSKSELKEREKRRKGEKLVIELRSYLSPNILTGTNGKELQKGMVLPFQPLSMSFSNINYYVDVPLLLFMKHGGELIYAGPLGPKSRKLIEFFEVSIEFPYVLVQTLVYGTIFYCMGSFEWSLAKYLWYIFFMYFTLLYFTFFGMMTIAITPNHTVAPIIAAPFYTLWNLFSGFMITHQRIPGWWRWYYWADPISWTLYGLLTSQFGDVDAPMNLSDGIHSVSIKLFLKHHFGFRHEFLGVVAVMVVGFCIIFAVVFALAVKYLNFQRR